MFARWVLGMEDGYVRMSLSITPRNDAGHCKVREAKIHSRKQHQKGGRLIPALITGVGMIFTSLQKESLERGTLPTNPPRDSPSDCTEPREASYLL